VLGHLIYDQYMIYCTGEHMKYTRIYYNVAHELKCTQMNIKTYSGCVYDQVFVLCLLSFQILPSVVLTL
jgi:hypothetical protein